ncbi:MAG: homoserine dehydrogenase [Alphaproteobacteria bacterium]
MGEDKMTADSAPFRLGIAGLGTVGAGVVKLVQQHGDMLADRAGRRIEISAVSARSQGADRGVDLSGYDWVQDARDLASRDDVDCVVEMIGGSEGVAKDLTESALSAGKSVVTANKALLAEHGAALAALAGEHGSALACEAAVAGGIPAIKALKEGLSGNQITALYGILNGTCNYILTEMRQTGRDFADVLAEAQALGYAEADPAFDVDGVDAAHKLAILAALAYGRHVDFSSVHIEGIRQISATDVAFARELGFRIRLVGMARETEAGVMQSVYPCMVPRESMLGAVDGVFNAVAMDGDFVDRVTLVGRGAGEGPTASAVMADIVDLAAGRASPVLGIPADRLQPARSVPVDQRTGPYYLRVMVQDQPGVVADIAAALRDQGVSIEALIQRARSDSDAVPVVITTHDVREDAFQRAVSAISGLEAVTQDPCVIRIEAL